MWLTVKVWVNVIKVVCMDKMRLYQVVSGALPVHTVVSNKNFSKKNDVNAKQEENYTAILIFKLIFLIIIVSYNLFHYLVLCVSTICTDNCFNASWHVEYEFLAIIIWDAMDLNVLNSFGKRFGTGWQPYFSNAPIHFQ